MMPIKVLFLCREKKIKMSAQNDSSGVQQLMELGVDFNFYYILEERISKYF